MTETERKLCAELWEEYEPEMRHACTVRLYGCDENVDDVIAELYLALCNHVSKHGSPRKPKGWLYGTLRNLTNQFFRSKYRQENNILSQSTDEIELPCPNNFVDDVEKNFTIEQLNGIISSLNKEEQTLLKLFYFEGWKIKEIAVHLGISESATKQKLYRLRHKLLKLLNSE